jgi:hypothetical protein
MDMHTDVIPVYKLLGYAMDKHYNAKSGLTTYEESGDEEGAWGDGQMEGRKEAYEDIIETCCKLITGHYIEKE